METNYWRLITLPAVFSLIGAWAGSYLSAYLKTKGENLATHEDISKLVDQVRAVTQTTKEIEAKISEDVWDRQRKWEMKRDLLFGMVKGLSAMAHSLDGAFATARMVQKIEPPNPALMEKHLSEMSLDMKTSLTSFNEAWDLARLVCSDETRDAVFRVRSLLNERRKQVRQLDFDAYRASSADYESARTMVHQRIKIELGIKEEEK